MNARYASLRTAALMAWLSLFAFAPAAASAAGTRVTGQVLDADTQRPVAGAEVELQNSGGGPGYFRARTDAKGEFALERVPSDRWYLITVSADGFTDWALESWQFPAAQREVRLVVPLDRAGRIEVSARGSDGKPVSAARVNVRRDRGANWWEAYRRDPEPRWTARDGRVLFDGLSSGAWTVSVEGAGLRPEETRAVPVRRGESTPVTLTLTRPAGLSGVVRLADSTAVGGVTVVVRGPGDGTATTAEDGSWTVSDLPPGRYRAELSYDGFEPGSARDGIVLAEGEARGGIVLTGLPRVPSLAFVLERDVFVPLPNDAGSSAARVQLGVRAFRAGALDLTLYRVPLARLLNPANGLRAGAGESRDTTGFERVSAWRHELPDGAPFAWREAQLTLPMELAPGAFLIVARAGTLQRQQLFFVSDLSMLVKRSGGKLVAWVGSLRTGLALPGVQVYAQGAPASEPAAREGARLAVGQLGGRGVVSDGDGLAWLTPLAGNSNASVIAVSERGGIAMVQSPLAPRSAVSGDKLFLFTERPIYRPGHTLFWKLFARRGGDGGYAVPERTRVTLALNGPERSLELPSATLAETGSATGEIAIPADAPLGEWTLTASTATTNTSATFGVQDYRKPEYKVEVTADREVVLNGDDVRFKLAADYFFGAPVVGATVRYTLFESRLDRERRWDEWDPWDDRGDSGEGEGGYGRLLQSGETRTDVDGRVSLTFTPARVAYDRKLSLEVEVLDGAQRMVNARGAALMGRGQFTLRVEPLARMVAAGQPIVADVHAEDLLGRPVQAAVTLELEQEVWNPVERRTTRSTRPLASLTGTTNATQGSVRATLSPATARAGYLTLRARAEDARGNKLVSESHVWVYDARVWDYAYRYPALEAVPDKSAWVPGDTAHILVNTDVKDAAVLVSVEGRELHELRVQHLFGRTGLVSVPLRAGYGPNVFVKLHVRRGREVQTRTLELPVRAARHDMTITVSSDKPEYRPRERAVLSVETRDASGAPVPAELAVGVVDEAVYALRADGTPRLHDVFYGRITNAVTTVAAFPVLYFGGADKGDRGDVRRDFRDVALWVPTLRTGADGRGRVDVTWPDNLTTWRATARGMSDATLVGETTAKTRVSKDIVARLALPRAFTAGDEAELLSGVTNRTATPLIGVKEALLVSGAARLNGAGGTASGIAAGGESRNRWKVGVAADPPRDGSDANARFTFRAQSSADADAIELQVPVRPRAVSLRLHGAGMCAGGTQSVSVPLPADLVASGSRLSVQAPRSVRAMLDDAAGWLEGYPYGCTEQTANALLALLARASGHAGQAARVADDTLAVSVTARVQRLAALRGSDGSWGWWAGGDPDPYLGALAVDALARAAAAGIQPEQCLGLVREAQYALLRQSSALRSVDGEAYWVMHLSALAEVPGVAESMRDLRNALDAVLTGVLAQRNALSPGGLACAALASARLGRAQDAVALLETMWSKSQAGDTGRWLPAGTDDDDWIGDTVERTAWALEAAARVRPGDARTGQFVAWLSAQRDGREWRSTRVTGAVITALAAWLRVHPEEARRAEPRVRWNGAALSATSPGVYPVPAERLHAGANVLEFTIEGGTPTAWSWSALAQVPSPGPAPDRSPLAVEREYLRAVRTADRRGRPRWLATPFDARQAIRVGEGVLVRLTLTATKDLRHVAIEDPVPAGFEIDQVLPDGVDRPWDLHAEAHDGRAMFFVGALPSGSTMIEYLLRPEIAGTFSALPTSGFGMYDPALTTRGSEARLHVVNP